ncbi:MAG: hypothetical protein GY882_03415 [Actinomycetia bacterium]|nr:hypothetical protein [Actinomycetes bacterium]MCP4845240.1 hypothetical protein [Actinomycetes bacterium]
MSQVRDYTWVQDANCAGGRLNDFFVEAGRVASNSVQQLCKKCPVREECVIDTYSSEFASGGYRAGFSPSQRRRLPLAKVLDVIRRESNIYRKTRRPTR